MNYLVKLKCHGCGREVEVEKAPKEFVCSDCGCVNIVPIVTDSDEPLGCIPPTGFEWTLPSGVLEGPQGKIFETAQGSHMSKQEYIDAFGFDPELAIEWERKMGREGKPGYFNSSTLGRKK